MDAQGAYALLSQWWTAAVDYVDSDGDEDRLISGFDSLGEFFAAADELAAWMQVHAVDPQPFWDAMLAISYRVEGEDSSVTVDSIRRLLDRAVLVIRWLHILAFPEGAAKEIRPRRPGRPPSPRVQKRREAVYKLHDKGLAAGKIAAKLREPVETVRQDLTRRPDKS